MTGNPGSYFGKQVKKERLARGWGLDELAKVTGIDGGHWSRIENGKRPPTAKVAGACDKAFPERKDWFIEYYFELQSWSEVPSWFKPWSEFEMTTITPDGTAIAHGCAVGQHPWPADGPQPGRTPPNSPPADPPKATPPESGPDPRRTADAPGATAGAQQPPQAARLLDLLRRLNMTLEPIARDTCAHAHAEDRYTPSRALRHLIQARNQTCTAPACNAQAAHCDLDHTVPHPDGPTDECNLNPRCKR